MHPSDTPTRTTTQASAPCKGEHERFIAAALDQVKRDKLPGNAFKVAYEIAMHVNRKTRLAWPSQTTIAGNTGLSETTVKKMIGLLRKRGHLDIEPGVGRGRSTRYRLLVVGAEKGRDHDTFVEAEKGSRSVEKRGAVEQTKGSDVCLRPSDRNLAPSNEGAQEGERDAALARSRSRSGGRLGATGKVVNQAKPAQQEILPPDSVCTTPSREESAAYAKVRSLWQRPWIDDELADRRAFAAACREVEPQIILDAAVRRVQAADDPRFLPTLAKWLIGRGWKKALPQHGRRGRASYPRTNGRKTDLARLALEMTQ